MPTLIAEFTLTIAVWIGIAAAAVVAAASLVALVRQSLAGALVFIAIVCAAAWGAYALTTMIQDGERRGIGQRLASLEAAMWAPASSLGCLASSADAVGAAACERVLFAKPETVAAATTFTAARLALFDEAMAFAQAHNASFAGELDRLRTSLEQDRYGFVAHVLKRHHGCTADACDMIRRFRDPAKLRANLREDALAGKIAAHRAAWSAPRPTEAGEAPVAADEPKHAPLPSNFTLPSSDSIPPVSIMDPEPATTGTAPGSSGPPAAAAPSATLPRPSRPPASNGSGRAAGPLQLGPADRP